MHHTPDSRDDADTAFEIIPVDKASSTYQKIVLPNLPGKEGAAVVPMNFHPDWRAYGSSGPLPVARAAGNLLAAGVSADDQRVEFRFEPPAWYSATLFVSLAFWAVAILLVLASGRPGVQAFRQALNGSQPGQ